MSPSTGILTSPVSPAPHPNRLNQPLLSQNTPRVSFACGDFAAIYVLDEKTSAVGLRLLPLDRIHREVPQRTHLLTPEILALPDWVQPVPASRGEAPLVQIKLAEDDYGAHFSGGRSMRQNPTVEALRLESQSLEETNDGFIIRTMLQGARAFTLTHVLEYRNEDEAVRVYNEFINTGSECLTLEMLSSFTIGHLSPFDTEDSRERLRIHRFRSSWSGEGRHEVVDLEDLHLERSWGSYSVVSERFGQIGSMPVRGFFPFVAIEDSREGVFWGAQICCASSWQMEVFRKDEKVSISGGLADREFGHWTKRIEPGESFSSPGAFLSTASTDLDGFCQRLTRMQARALENVPAIENALPILFNEWCSSWGKPTPEFILQTAEKLKELPVNIFVIDDGWAEKPENAAQFNGDWIVEKKRFPDGLKPVADALRSSGFIPGLWFEFEVCTEGTEAFKLKDHKLRRDGRILKVGTRHFWDFTDPWTFNYLTEKVINRLRNDGFGYLKVDYNDTIGMGCDDPDSLGEGLRKHIVGVQRFFRKLREELPELIIESCSSGGHRLEPSMMELASMASFSDAHESTDIPIIAANLHRLILPRQSQIWAVLHPQDSLQRFFYSLSACFLGRACLSGEITQLSSEQMSLIDKCLLFYRQIAPIIREGESRIYRRMNKSYRSPEGWQSVVRLAQPDPSQCLIVTHAFGSSAGSEFRVPLPEGKWTLVQEASNGIQRIGLESSALRLRAETNFSAHIAHYQSA